MSIAYDKAKEELKLHLEDYLKSHGINPNLPFNCLNPEHPDKNPSMSFDRKRNKVHCFSCDADWDIIDLIEKEYDLDNKADAFKKGYELFNIKVYDNTQYTHNKHNTDNTHKNYASNPVKSTKNYKEQIEQYAKAYYQTSYLRNRGISDKIANSFNVGFSDSFYFVSEKKDVQPFNAPAVIIPTGENSFSARCIDSTKPVRYNKRGASEILNIGACVGDEPIFVVEGEIDALSVIEAGYKAIALGSASNTKKLIEYLEDKKATNSFILCLDNDERGIEAQTKLFNELKELQIPCFRANIAGNFKDANEALINDKEAFISGLEKVVTGIENKKKEQKAKEVEEYSKNYASNCLQDFLDGIKEKANTPYISTGFAQLDKVLDGGLFEGVYYIGAISSLGKTTFTLQIADQIAQQGHDVMIFSLEMSKHELIAKSISRLTLTNCQNNMQNAKTTRGITTYSRYIGYSDTERALINTAIKKYSDYANHIVIHEGQGNIGVEQIRQAVEKHISITGNKPVVIIDYLQIIAPYNDRATDKNNIDKAVTELKRISRDFKLSVVAISSLNRDNYSSRITMQAFKESGGIEYSSDVLIGLQFKGQGEKNFDIDQAKKNSNDMNSPRQIELKILKNRNGRTGDSLFYDYYPLFNYFKEQ